MGGTVLAGGALVGIEFVGTVLIGIEVVGGGFGGQAWLVLDTGVKDGGWVGGTDGGWAGGTHGCWVGGVDGGWAGATDEGWVGGVGPKKFCWQPFLHDDNHDEMLAVEPGGNGTEAEDPGGNGTEAEDLGGNGTTLERASHYWSWSVDGGGSHRCERMSCWWRDWSATDVEFGGTNSGTVVVGAWRTADVEIGAVTGVVVGGIIDTRTWETDVGGVTMF